MQCLKILSLWVWGLKSEPKAIYKFCAEYKYTVYFNAIIIVFILQKSRIKFSIVGNILIIQFYNYPLIASFGILCQHEVDLLATRIPRLNR